MVREIYFALQKNTFFIKDIQNRGYFYQKSY